MASNYSVSLKKLIKEFNLEKVWAPENIEEIRINTNEVNRPGLQLAGFTNFLILPGCRSSERRNTAILKTLARKCTKRLMLFFPESQWS